jgi:hypothetical protein
VKRRMAWRRRVGGVGTRRCAAWTRMGVADCACSEWREETRTGCWACGVRFGRCRRFVHGVCGYGGPVAWTGCLDGAVTERLQSGVTCTRCDSVFVDWVQG